MVTYYKTDYKNLTFLFILLIFIYKIASNNLFVFLKINFNNKLFQNNYGIKIVWTVVRYLIKLRFNNWLIFIVPSNITNKINQKQNYNIYTCLHFIC